MSGCAVVVIGHVDHGKTALVQALTGNDTDRLPEEKRRGLSILPGFAHRAYPVGTVDFIDAPGHADFIRAMVAGASGAQAALLVVSARDGVAAQTVEHLAIARILGIDRGVIALSKCDGLSQSALSARIAEVTEALRGTGLANAPVVACSARDGLGLEALHREIGALVDTAAATGPPGAFLPIDRVFSVPGRGTVVTGTLLGAEIGVGQSLVVQPGGQPVVLRGLQSRGVEVGRVTAGTRVAANLSALSTAEVAMGDVLCALGGPVPATMLDLSVGVLPEARPLRHMDQIRVLIGTRAAVGRMRLLQALEPGQTGIARLEFDRPIVSFAGQRAVLRHLTPPQTCAGAVVLDPSPPRGRLGDRGAVLAAAGRGDLADIAAALARQGGAALANIARLGRVTAEAAWDRLAPDHSRLDGDLIVACDVLAAARDDLLARLHRFHADHPLKPAAPRAHADLPAPVLRHLEAALLADGLIRREGGGLALATHDPLATMAPGDRAAMTDLEDRLRDAGLRPPELADAEVREADLMALLLRAGRTVRLHNVALDQRIVFHADAIDGAASVLRAAFPPPIPFRTGEARSVLATSRKFIVPVLEHFDSLGLTVRTGDQRRMRE